MNWTQTVRMALKSILNNKIRSLLTMLGIIIGVASVIAIVASIQGTTKLQRLQYEAMGANRIDVYAWGAKNKDWKDFEEYLDSLDEVAAWSPQSQYWDWQNGGVQYRSKKMDSNSSDNGYLQMYFVNEHYGEVTSMSISAGRDLTEADCKSRARVCVIGETLRKYFFGAMSPIGQELRIGGKSFEIVGVYAGKYGGKLNTNDQMLIMPYTLQSLMMSSQGMSDHQYIIKAENAEDIQTLTEQTLPEFMQPRCEANGGYFSAYSNSQSQKQQEASSNLMALLGGGIASHLASGRRHRHHEHHARVRYRAHARNRHPHGDRRAQARHHRSVPCGSGGRELLRRHHRHCARLLCLGGARQVHACPSAPAEYVSAERRTVHRAAKRGSCARCVSVFRSARHYFRPVPCQQGI